MITASTISHAVDPEQRALIGSGRPLRIGVVTFAFAPVLSGVASGTQYRVRRLLERGHDVLLVHPDVGTGYEQSIPVRDMTGLAEFEDHPRFQSFAYPTRPLRFRKSHPEPMSHRHWSVVEPLKQFDADVVVVEEPVGMRGTVSAGLGGYRRPVGPEYSQQTGRPVVGILHTDWIGFAERALGRLASRLLLWAALPVLTRASRQFTHMVAPSQYLTKRFNDLGDFGIEHLACHGIDCSEFHPDNIRFDPIPEIVGPVLVNSGRIEAEKSIPVLLDAFAHIQKDVPDVRLYVLGEGDDRRQLQQEAQRRFGDRVQFPGQFSGERLQGWYARADAYVVASEAENFCSANLEALASGTPVVAAASGGNVEQVSDGVNGFLFEPGDAQQMADRVVEILRDDERRSGMAKAARQSALHYDYNVCTDRLLEFIHRRLPERQANDSRATICSDSVM